MMKGGPLERDPFLPRRQAKLDRKGAELTDDFLVINRKKVSCGAEIAVPKYRQRKMRGDGLSEVAAGPPEEARPRVRIFHLKNPDQEHYVGMGMAQPICII